MLIVTGENVPHSRSRQREARLWHDDARHSAALGCTRCPDRAVCGGLQIDRGVFDCTALCCGQPDLCDAVCRNRPEDFARRVREVGGFSLSNVPRAPILSAPELPTVVPTIFHGDSRIAPFEDAEAVCLPLYKVIHRHDRSIRYATRADLAAGFRLPPAMPIILTGTAADPALERWWSAGAERRAMIRDLRHLGITMVTTPNFSLFVDQPRWDDLHSMKRIALVHEDFLSEGLPAALHVNARTDHDWERWRDYIAARPEVTHIAFEFATGAGRTQRIRWHLNHLTRLPATVDRSLHLLVRGGARILPWLAAAFPRMTVLDTSVFVKTMKRPRASLSPRGSASWSSSPTMGAQGLDDLLSENWQVIAASYKSLLTPATQLSQAAAG
jgi:hypothetical protein